MSLIFGFSFLLLISFFDFILFVFNCSPPPHQRVGSVAGRGNSVYINRVPLQLRGVHKRPTLTHVNTSLSFCRAIHAVPFAPFPHSFRSPFRLLRRHLVSAFGQRVIPVYSPSGACPFGLANMSRIGVCGLFRLRDLNAATSAVNSH